MNPDQLPLRTDTHFLSTPHLINPERVDAEKDTEAQASG